MREIAVALLAMEESRLHYYGVGGFALMRTVPAHRLTALWAFRLLHGRARNGRTGGSATGLSATDACEDR